jgi:hypothetical protein
MPKVFRGDMKAAKDYWMTPAGRIFQITKYTHDDWFRKNMSQFGVKPSPEGLDLPMADAYLNGAIRILPIGIPVGNNPADSISVTMAANDKSLRNLKRLINETGFFGEVFVGFARGFGSALIKNTYSAEEILEMESPLALTSRRVSRGRKGKYFATPYHLLLDYGWFEPGNERPEDVPQMKMKMCYLNAYQLAAENPGLAYMEGVATTGILPVNHAWCWDPNNGQVYDPTWQDGIGYWGVGIKLPYVSKVMEQTEMTSALWNWMSEPHITDVPMTAWWDDRHFGPPGKPNRWSPIKVPKNFAK